jgi:predicted histidine transporter YuiF (NhaC family)
LLSAPFAALGIIIGLAMAIVNLRFLDAGVAKVQTKGEVNRKVLRRAMGTKSVTRLAVITVIAIGLLFLNGALGIGTVIGLVIFQLFFVLNVGRVVMSPGIQ